MNGEIMICNLKASSAENELMRIELVAELKDRKLLENISSKFSASS